MGTHTPTIEIETPKPWTELTGTIPVKVAFTAGQPDVDRSVLTAVWGFLNGQQIFLEYGNLGFSLEVDTFVDSTQVRNGKGYLICYAADNEGMYRTKAIPVTVKNG